MADRSGTPRPPLAPVPDEASAIDQYVYQSDVVAIGRFRCPVAHPLFADSGPIRNHCVVFPRTRARIAPAGGEAFESDRGVAAVYNAGQEYRRAPVSIEGDHCDYFAVRADVLAEAMEDAPRAIASPDAGFRVSHLPAPASLYLRQRGIFRRAAAGVADTPATTGDAARVDLDEAVVDLVGRLLRPGEGWPAPLAARRHRDLAAHARALLASETGRGRSLSDLAREAGASVFHLCRVFRAVTGATLHEYRERLRLAAALDRLEGGDAITEIALDLGYSSHSHFTAAFRAAHGVTPSAYRRLPAAARRGLRQDRSGPATRI